MVENSVTKVRFNDEIRYKNSSREEVTPQPEEDLEFTDKQAEDLGYYLLRKNYRVFLNFPFRLKMHNRQNYFSFYFDD
jgi:hypothetical protein